MTATLTAALQRIGALAAVVDTRDPRPNPTRGRFDVGKVVLSLRSLVDFVQALCANPHACVYVPVSQASWGYLRDGAFIALARLARRPIVVHLHGGYLRSFYAESPPVMRWYMRKTLRMAAQGWVLTERLRPHLTEFLPEAAVRVVSNATEPPATLRCRDHSAEELHLVFLSNLRPGKGHRELLASLRVFSGQGVELRVTLAGEATPSERCFVLSEIESLRATGIDVEYVGPVTADQRWCLLEQADVLAMPSHYRFEGQPLVILEAMSAGLAILATRHAGIPDTVRGGVDGWLVAPGDQLELECALKSITGERAEVADRGHSARERYLDRYSLDAFDQAVREALLAVAST